jgi:hypothetical protein
MLDPSQKKTNLELVQVLFRFTNNSGLFYQKTISWFENKPANTSCMLNERRPCDWLQLLQANTHAIASATGMMVCKDHSFCIYLTEDFS